MRFAWLLRNSVRALLCIFPIVPDNRIVRDAFSILLFQIWPPARQPEKSKLTRALIARPCPAVAVAQSRGKDEHPWQLLVTLVTVRALS